MKDHPADVILVLGIFTSLFIGFPIFMLGIISNRDNIIGTGVYLTCGGVIVGILGGAILAGIFGYP